MKYTCEIIIDKPIAEVITLFDDPENMKEWQPGFVSYEHLDGEYGKPGSRMRLKYKMGNRDIEMIETLITRDLPSSFVATYEAKGVFNKIEAHFEELSATRTKWVQHQEFEMSGMMKVMRWVMPGAFKKQSMIYLRKFKEFAERS